MKALRQVSPSFASTNIVDGRHGNAQCTRQFSGGCLGCSDGTDDIGCQFSAPVAQATLRHSVQRIVLSRAEPKVCWIDTRRIVAPMKHLKACVERPEGDFVAHPMGKHLGSMHLESPVTTLHYITRPHPTTVRLANERPKAFFVGSEGSVVGVDASNIVTGPLKALPLRRRRPVDEFPRQSRGRRRTGGPAVVRRNRGVEG